MPLYSEGQNLSANQISSTYFNSWLRYNYFRFGKINVRHIGILLPVSMSVISPQSACYSIHRCNFKWPWTTLSLLANFFTTLSLYLRQLSFLSSLWMEEEAGRERTKNVLQRFTPGRRPNYHGQGTSRWYARSRVISPSLASLFAATRWRVRPHHGRYIIIANGRNRSGPKPAVWVLVGVCKLSPGTIVSV